MTEPNPALQLYMVETLPTPGGHPLSPTPSQWEAGSSAAMTKLRVQIRRVAPYFRTALLVGERSSGDEAAAHILHQLSPLSHRPFVTVTPAEAERLFGAHSSPDTVAAQGMLYIPFPDRLSHIAQSALLGLVRKRGSKAPRVVAFAERGLRQLVSSGAFSPKLAESLGVLRVALPPLRNRSEDIPALLTHILQGIAARSGHAPPQLTADLLDAAMKLPWPGNLTQLHSAAEGLMKHPAKGLLHTLDLETVRGSDRREICMMCLDDVRQEHVRGVLFACGGNKLRAAEVLGISRSSLYRMLETETHSSSQKFP